MSVSRPCTVLHVDDDPDFCDLTKTVLEREHDRFDVVTTTDPTDVLPMFAETDIDCLLTDYDMPGMDGIELLERVRVEYPSLPVVLFTGKGTEDVASRAISAGVTDYLRKESGSDQFTVLANRITNAVDHRADERRREQYRTAVETAGDAMYVLDEAGRIEMVNEAFETEFGYDRQELVGEHVSEFLAAEQAESGTAAGSPLEREGRDAEMFTFRAERPDGGPRLYETMVSLVEQDDFSGSVGVVRDITDERRTEKLFSGLFEQSLHGIGVKEIVTDDDGAPVDYIYKRVNDRFEELTGLDADEVVGKRATEVLEGIEDTPFIDVFGEVALEDTTAQFEQYSAPLNKHYEVSAFSPRHGECISIFSDITERTEREQELERYEQLIEYSPDVLTVLDEEMTVEYQSPTSPLFDWKPKDVDGGDPLEWIHPDDRSTVSEHLRRLAAEPGCIDTVEFRTEDADGEWQWTESRAQNFTDSEQIDGILAVMREVSHRKRQEQQLEQYGETLAQLQDTTQALLETTDAADAATRVIEGFETVLDFDIVGIWLRDDDGERLEPTALSNRGDELVSAAPTYTADTESLSWEAYRSQELRYIEDMSDCEKRLNPETPIGSELIVPLGQYGLLNIGATEPEAFTDREVELVELWAETLAVVLARIVQFDLLQEREAALERERNRLDEFASVISHDLRNPLNVAMARTELAAGECDSKHLTDVTQALTRMEELLEDMLVLARQGEVIGETEPIDLDAVATQCWRTVSAGEATLRTEHSATIYADRSRFAELLGNLFQNAVRHGGKPVTITVGTTDDGFYVADDGCGIRADDCEDLFESGFTTMQEGTGFGLAIVSRICEAHGWEITATESTAGGARFEITGVEFVE